MKKILFFVDSFLPGYKGGGPITSMINLTDLLDKDYNIYIVTKNHDVGDSKPYSDIIFNKVIKYNNYNVAYLSTSNISSIKKIILDINPDLIYLNGLFPTTTQIVIILNKFLFKKKLIIAPRGELQKNALSIKRNKKAIYLFFFKLLNFKKSITFHSTDSIETTAISNQLKPENIFELKNIIKKETHNPLSKTMNELKLIFVSRISKKKNLDYALNILKSCNITVTFDIYGPKEDGDYWEKCQSIINTLPPNITVKYRGSLDKDEVTKTMRRYHVFFFPTLSENFGHVIVEAMQSGVVPIISDQTPWLNLEKNRAGWSLDLKDVKAFSQAVETLHAMDSQTYNQLSRSTMDYITEQLNIGELKEKYIEMFERVMKGSK